MNTTYSERSFDETSRCTAALLVLILLIATFLRAWGIAFGLPFIFHADEPFHVDIAQQMFKTGNLEPPFLTYPSLSFYLNALAYVPYFLVGKRLGVFTTPADIPAPQMLAMGVGRTAMPTTFLLWRCLSAVYGIASVALIFLAGMRLSRDRRVALLAALALAVSPTNVRYGQLITPDILATLWGVLCVYASLGIANRGRLQDYVLAGVAGGLAVGSKYNAALLLLPIVLAHFLSRGKKGLADGRLYLALLLCGVVFLLTTPFALLAWPRFWEHISFDRSHYAKGHLGGEGDSLRWYLSYLWQSEGPLVLFSLFALVHSALARHKQRIIVSITSILYAAFVCSFTVHNDRTILPIVPFCVLLGASGVVRVYDLIRDRWPQVRMRGRIEAVGAVLLALALIVPVARTIQRNVRQVSIDSRITASLWIAANLPKGSHIALEAYTPWVDPDVFHVKGFGHLYDQPAKWYAENGFQYLVFGELMYDRFYREPERYASQVAKYEELFHALRPVRIFNDGGYEVRIYQVVP